MQNQEKSLLSGQSRTCPLRGGWISFRLVDEFGDAKPYAGLSYVLTDSEGTKYQGNLDGEAFARLTGTYSGPLILTLSSAYAGAEKFYVDMSERIDYPLPITELQVAAEKTLRRPVGSTSKTGAYRASAEKGEYHKVEVRDFVEFNKHLPPAADLTNPLPTGCAKLARDFAGDKVPSFGIGLLPEKHYVLEVRALRAFRPLLSLAPKFSALNLYQLSLLATLSYGDFGQKPEKLEATLPKDFVFTYPTRGSVGHVLNTCLACFEEPTKYADSKNPSFPLVEYGPTVTPKPAHVESWTQQVQEAVDGLLEQGAKGIRILSDEVQQNLEDAATWLGVKGQWIRRESKKAWEWVSETGAQVISWTDAQLRAAWKEIQHYTDLTVDMLKEIDWMQVLIGVGTVVATVVVAFAIGAALVAAGVPAAIVAAILVIVRLAQVSWALLASILGGAAVTAAVSAG